MGQRLVIFTAAIVCLCGCPPETLTVLFSATPTSGVAPLRVQFTDETIPGPEPITGWQWEFGDGTTSSLQSPVHNYQEPGSYDVRLTISSAAGKKSLLMEDFIVVQAEETGEGDGEQEGEPEEEPIGDAEFMLGDIGVSHNSIWNTPAEEFWGITSSASFYLFPQHSFPAPPRDTCRIWPPSFGAEGEDAGTTKAAQRPLDAGAVGSVRVGNETAELAPLESDPSLLLQEPMAIPLNNPDAVYEVSFPGGADLPAFSASIEIPGVPVFTSPQMTADLNGNTVLIDFSQDLNLVWDATDPGDHISVTIEVTDLSWETPYRECTCILEDDGDFTIPASILARLDFDPSNSDLKYDLFVQRSIGEDFLLTTHDGITGEVRFSSLAQVDAQGI